MTKVKISVLKPVFDVGSAAEHDAKGLKPYPAHMTNRVFHDDHAKSQGLRDEVRRGVSLPKVFD